LSLPVSGLQPEPYIDAKHAAQYLSMSPKKLLCLARSGGVPAHGIGGTRKMWRFRLSELDHWMQTEVTSAQRLRPCSRRIS
jgi:excisionase family DNA binding protein